MNDATNYTLSTVPADAILSRAEAARLLDCSISTLLRRLKAKEITAMRDGRILGQAVIEYAGPLLKQVRFGTVSRARSTDSASLRALAKSGRR